MTPTCPTCHREVPRPQASGQCLPCERRSESLGAWSAAVAAPKCGCGRPLSRCDDCAAMHCTAPGHLQHRCATQPVLIIAGDREFLAGGES